MTACEPVYPLMATTLGAEGEPAVGVGGETERKKG
jgi:hypothetical protein